MACQFPGRQPYREPVGSPPEGRGLPLQSTHKPPRTGKSGGSSVGGQDIVPTVYGGTVGVVGEASGGAFRERRSSPFLLR